MKPYLGFLFAFAFAVAEPPSYRQARFRYQRLELATHGPSDSNKEATTKNPIEAPYEPAGYQPTKEFSLPARQEITPPATSYGVPVYETYTNTLASPQTEYGPSKSSETDTKDSVENTNDTENKKVDKVKVEEITKTEDNTSRGGYFALLQDNQLQKVDIKTQNDLTNIMAYIKLKSSNENLPFLVYTAVPQIPSGALICTGIADCTRTPDS